MLARGWLWLAAIAALFRMPRGKDSASKIDWRGQSRGLATALDERGRGLFRRKWLRMLREDSAE